MMTLDDLFAHRIQQVASAKAQEEAELRRQALSIEGEKQKLLEDPAKIDKAVASMADYYSPTASTKRPKGEIYGVDTVEGSKDPGDPTVGFGNRLREEYANALASPQFRGIPAGQLLHGISKGLVESPGEDGKSLLEKSYEFSKLEDSRLWGGVQNKKMPGYDAWLADKKLQEKQQQDKESWLPSLEDMATGTGAGAVLGAAIGATGGGLAGVGSGAASGAATGAAIGGLVGGPVGAGLGAGVGALGGGLAGFFGGEATGAAAGGLVGGIMGAGGELLAAPIKKLVHTTDWYQGMIGSNKWQDKAKAMLADVAAYIPGAELAKAGSFKAFGKAVGELGATGSLEGLVEGKVPRGPGIDLSGERINPAGSWAADGASISRAPMPPEAPFRPAGLLEEMIPSGELPPPPGAGGAGTVFSGGPEVPNAPIMSGYTPELPKLLGGGKGYEWPGQGNLGRAENLSPFEATDFLPTTKVPSPENPRAQLLLEDLQGNDKVDFENFAKEARSKVYSELPGVPEKSPVLTEDELFKNWQLMAEKGSRPFNPYADSQAVDSVIEANKKLIKARQDVLDNPAASNVMEVVKGKPGEVKLVAGSDIVEKSQGLSPEGLQETGLEPITDPGIKPLQGNLGTKIAQASERDTFVEIAREPATGKNRTAIAENAARDIKSKLAPESVNKSSVSDEITKIDESVVVTPKQQKQAIDNVTKYTKRGKAVQEEFFPKANEVEEGGVSLIRPGEDILSAEFNAARKPLSPNVGEGGIEVARREYYSTLETTPEEFAADLKNMAKGDPELHKQLIDEQNAEFTEWAKEKGFVPNDMNRREENRAKYKLVAGMAAMLGTAGVTSVLYDQLAGTKADAGWITASAETIAKKAALMQDSLAKGLVAESVKAGQTVMGKVNFQSGIILNPKEVINTVTENIRKGTGAGVQYSLMSPYQVIEALFKTGSGKMVNAATNLASFVTAGSRTKDNASRVVQNILDGAGIKTAANQVREAMKPIVPLGAKAAKAEVAATKLGLAEKRLAGFMEKAKSKRMDEFAQDIAKEQSEIASMKATLEELGGATKQYHEAWSATAQKLAAEHPSVRVSLALEDPERKLYPWLPKLTRDEEVAVGKLRSLLDQYQVRLKERGVPTRENYFPHSPHPEMSKMYQAEMADILGGAPYQKFFSRTANSRALLPDISYSMSHYLNDIEPRIQNHDFWKTSGWGLVRDLDAVQQNPGLKRAFDQLYEGTRGSEDTWGNIAAKRYSEFEALNKLFLAPSAGLKHLVKMSADIVSVGPQVWIKSLPETVGYLSRKVLNKTYGINQVSIRDGLAKMGIKSERFGRQLIDDYMDSAIMSGNIRKYMLDMGIDSHEQVFSTAKNLWNKAQDVGSTWINVAELIDRATSVSSALQMAGKRGMTVDQAMYGTYDLILKNNFLFNEFNPSWLNNPKIRALLMFQATPFKIFERRIVNAQRSIENIKGLSKEVQAILKQDGGFEKIKSDILNMRAYLRDGQSELKSNLFIDAARNETDFFGTPVLKQMVTDMMTVAGATYAGAQVGLALGDHFFHIPFLSTMSDEGKAELALSPLISSTMKGYNKWKNDATGEDFLLKNIMDRWLGPYGPLPKTLEKAVKLHNGDIPEIYQKGGGSGYLRYLFSVPGKE